MGRGYVIDGRDTAFERIFRNSKSSKSSSKVLSIQEQEIELKKKMKARKLKEDQKEQHRINKQNDVVFTPSSRSYYKM